MANTTAMDVDVVAERAWNKLGAQVATMVGLDLFQYALELDNNGTVWLDSVWLLTSLIINTRDKHVN